MKTLALTGLVLFGMVGVANADSPGGWSQFDAMVKGQGQKARVVAAAPQQKAPEVNFFSAAERSGTWVSQPNPHEGANN